MCRLLSTADDNATIRVTNLSEDTRETDLQELFRPFGSISRIYLAKDKNTGQSKVSMELVMESFEAYFMPVSPFVVSATKTSVSSNGLSVFFCYRDLLSSVSTVGRMQPEPLQECQDLDTIILFSMLNGPSKFS